MLPHASGDIGRGPDGIQSQTQQGKSPASELSSQSNAAADTVSVGSQPDLAIDASHSFGGGRGLLASSDSASTEASAYCQSGEAATERESAVYEQHSTQCCRGIAIRFLDQLAFARWGLICCIVSVNVTLYGMQELWDQLRLSTGELDRDSGSLCGKQGGGIIAWALLVVPQWFRATCVLLLWVEINRGHPSMQKIVRDSSSSSQWPLWLSVALFAHDACDHIAWQSFFYGDLIPIGEDINESLFYVLVFVQKLSKLFVNTMLFLELHAVGKHFRQLANDTRHLYLEGLSDQAPKDVMSIQVRHVTYGPYSAEIPLLREDSMGLTASSVEPGISERMSWVDGDDDRHARVRGLFNLTDPLDRPSVPELGHGMHPPSVKVQRLQLMVRCVFRLEPYSSCDTNRRGGPPISQARVRHIFNTGFDCGS